MEFDLATERMKNQRLGYGPLNSPLEVVRYMCGIQAQEDEMAKWGIGIRMINPDHNHITAELDAGTIIRTHIFRPTWHYIPGEDLKWMMAFSSPYIKRLNASREKQYGLDGPLLRKTRKIIESAFKEQPHLTKEQITIRLQANKINMGAERPIHILYDAECCGLICSGPRIGHRHSYALVDLRVPNSIQKSGEEALVELTKRYFQSHGPATTRDFAKWISIPLAKAKEGIASLGNTLQTWSSGGVHYYFIPGPETTYPMNDFFMLPAYDEYLIGYADRSFALEEKYKKSTMTANGILYPTLIYRGKVKGRWIRKKSGTGYAVGFDWFYPPSSSLTIKAKKALKLFETFTSKTTSVL